jgi:hypothetical protein
MRFRSALQVACAALLVWICVVSSASSATRRVVLLFDERPELPGLAQLEAELVRTLGSSSAEPIEVYREAMDLSRFSSDAYEVLLRDFLQAKYAVKKVDLTVALMGPALDFLLSYGNAVFPGTPIVFCGIDRTYLRNRSMRPHVSGVLVRREFAPTLELALRLHPSTENVVVVSGRSEFDTTILEAARTEFQAYEGRVSLRYLRVRPESHEDRANRRTRSMTEAA